MLTSSCEVADGGSDMRGLECSGYAWSQSTQSPPPYRHNEAEERETEKKSQRGTGNGVSDDVAV